MENKFNETMKKIELLATAVAACVLVLVSVPVFGQEKGGRPWTVEDSVTNRYFVNLESLSAGSWSGTYSGLSVSPDGKHFLLVTERGDVACDCTRYEMSIWSAEQVRQAIAAGRKVPVPPVRVVNMASTSNDIGFAGSAIRDIKWENNETLLFLGTGEIGSNDGVFRYAIKTGRLQRLTGPEHRVPTTFGGGFDVKGDTIVYQTLKGSDREMDPKTGLPAGFNKYPLQPVRGVGQHSGLADALSHAYSYTNGAFVGTKGGQALALFPSVRNGAITSAPSLSPDGRWAVVAVPHDPEKPVPAEWRRYEGLDIPIPFMGDDSKARLQKFVLFDTRTGKGRAMLDLPAGPNCSPTLPFSDLAATALWSADGKRVLLVNVSLPLTEDGENRKRKGYIVDYEVATGKWTVLTPIRADDSSLAWVQWRKEGKEILVQRTGGTTRKQISDAVFEYTETGWRYRVESTTTAPMGPVAQPEPILEGGLQVKIRESANDPPMAVATDGKGEVALIAQDPALDNIRRARYQVVKWDERNGHVQEGGLYLPPDTNGKRPYPLVVQINVANPNRFWPDGASRTSFAAQALAARGMAVLQVRPVLPDSAFTDYKDRSGRPYKGQSGTPEWLRAVAFRERIERAVGELVREGLVDPNRVGIVGFSFTGYLSYYVATHPNSILPRAAIVADSEPRTYMSQTLFPGGILRDSTQNNYAKGVNRLYGGQIWEKGATESWLEHDPSMNVDKMETPVLFSFNGNIASLYFLEPKAIFRTNKKEADFMMFPDAGHQIARPRQRQASLQATVDWMSFWLLGKEIDPDKNEARREQYFYWRKLKKQRDERWAKNGSPYDKLAKQNAAASSSAPAKATDPPTAAEKPEDQ